MKRLSWRIGVAAVLIVGLFVWLLLPRQGLPEQAAEEFLGSVIAADFDWMYEHAFEEERAIPGFSKETIREFYSKFVAEIEGAERAGNGQFLPPNEAKTTEQMAIDLRLKDGRMVKATVVAYGENGEKRVGVIEGLWLLSRALDASRNEPRRGLKPYLDWLRTKGVDRIYLAQADDFYGPGD